MLSSIIVAVLCRKKKTKEITETRGVCCVALIIVIFNLEAGSLGCSHTLLAV